MKPLDPWALKATLYPGSQSLYLSFRHFHNFPKTLWQEGENEGFEEKLTSAHKYKADIFSLNADLGG